MHRCLTLMRCGLPRSPRASYTHCTRHQQRGATTHSKPCKNRATEGDGIRTKISFIRPLQSVRSEVKLPRIDCMERLLWRRNTEHGLARPISRKNITWRRHGTSIMTYVYCMRTVRVRSNVKSLTRVDRTSETDIKLNWQVRDDSKLQQRVRWRVLTDKKLLHDGAPFKMTVNSHDLESRP